jgi:thiol-disulfide isomerase/thioredoxin
MGWVGSLLLLVACKPALPSVTTASCIQIRQQINKDQAPLTLVHIWATWCGPCREEFPELVKIQQNFSRKGLHLILVSVDDPADSKKVEIFLVENRSPLGSLVSSRLDQTFIETFSTNWTGALPASFFYANGKLQAEWEGKRNYEQYAETIKSLLKNKESP